MTHILIPRTPSMNLLRPFIECPTSELDQAWAAMVRIAEVQHARAGSQCLAQIEEPAQPVLYVSPGQLANHSNPEGPESEKAGRYLPARVTPAGKFTQPLYAGEAPATVAPRARDLLGIVRTAQAEARRLINGEDSCSDLAQTKLDLPETLRVLEHALSQPAAVAGPALDVTLDEDQAGLLRDMLGDPAEYEEALTVRLIVCDGHSGHGLYVAQAEYQGEGAALLAPLPATAAPALEAPAAPVTLMTEDQASRWAWDQIREEVGTKGWTAGDSSNFFGFFLHGWNYRGQYELQRPAAMARAALAAAPQAPAAPAVDALSQAARDVLAERTRQVNAEGFSHARDDQYVGGQLAGAAASYLILAAGGREDEARAFWPWRQEWLKPGSQRRYMEKACALGLAEMERMDRSAAQAKEGGAA